MARLFKCDLCDEVIEDDKEMALIEVHSQTHGDETDWVEFDVCGDCQPSDIHEFVVRALKREWKRNG